MYQISQTTQQSNFLRDEVDPIIYSGYPTVLEATYDKTQNQTQISKKLYNSYLVKNKPIGKRYVETNYEKPEQQVYVMRYFIPHSLLVPFILDSLSRQTTDDFFSHINSELLKRESLIASFLGGGPCPELYGLTHYLSKIQYNPTNISSAIFDKIKWKIGLNTEHYFKTDLAGQMNNFLTTDSREWVRKSDLIVIQNCLNEIPGVSFNYDPQLLSNMIHIANLMKPGALMLVIERYGYKLVMDLLIDFRSDLDGFNNVQTYYSSYEQLEFEDLNNNVNIPDETLEYLRCNWLWMSNHIKFHWLAISKQKDFYDPYAGIDIVPQHLRS